jgi:hypothetical protein
MPTAKARYVGDGAGRLPCDFTDELRKTLRGYYPKEDALINIGVENAIIEKTGEWYSFNNKHIGHDESNASQFLKDNHDIADEIEKSILATLGLVKLEDIDLFNNLADEFVNVLLAEARWAVSALMWQEHTVTKQEILAEHSDLHDTLKYARNKLRELSPDFNRLLDADADPLGVADSLDVLIRHVNAAEVRINELPKKMRLDEAQHDIAVEMAIRVLRAVKNYGLPIYATGGDGFDYTSDAVNILKAIGDDINLPRERLTWRDIIIEAKRVAPDLQ